MALINFEEISELVKNDKEVRTVALVMAEDEHSLEAVAEVVKHGLVKPLLIGNRKDIIKTAEKVGINVLDESIYDAEDADIAAILAVKLVKEGTADFLMKGGLETAQLLKEVVNKENGLSNGGVMSHVAVNQVCAYHKLLITTDGGMIPYPNLEQKKSIIENAVEVLRKLGYEKPKVCVLAATEKMNPKMIETIDAAELKEMNQRGEIRECIVEGPISLDLALVKERSEVKGYNSQCAGDADILVVPNIHAGNMLGKSLVEMAHAKMAGVIMGAQCPIVLTSRGSSAEEKFNSLMLACVISERKDRNYD